VFRRLVPGEEGAKAPLWASTVVLNGHRHTEERRLAGGEEAVEVFRREIQPRRESLRLALLGIDPGDLGRGDPLLPFDGIEADRRQAVVGRPYRDRAADLEPPAGRLAPVGLLFLGDEKLRDRQIVAVVLPGSVLF
jgi:hypothetical protein